MSRLYQRSGDVPLEDLCKRLDELSDAVAKGCHGGSEFTMRIPAEVDRDADIVLAEAARRLRELGAKNPPKIRPDTSTHAPQVASNGHAFCSANQASRAGQCCDCHCGPALKSPCSPIFPNIHSALDVAEDKIQELEVLIIALRADIRELYSMRGEDELTAKYCNTILAATADF